MRLFARPTSVGMVMAGGMRVASPRMSSLLVPSLLAPSVAVRTFATRRSDSPGGGERRKSASPVKRYCRSLKKPKDHPKKKSSLLTHCRPNKSGRKKGPVRSEAETEENQKKYRADYYAKNRDRLLERNKKNRATKSALAKVGIYTTGKKGRPVKKRADVGQDDNDMLTPEELQREIERHEQAHEEWLAQVEADRAELLRMYEEDDDDAGNGEGGLDDMDEPTKGLLVGDVVRILRTHGARDVVTLDLRQKTDMCDHKIIVTGSSPAQMRALADTVFMAFKRHKRFHSMPKVEGRNNPDWVLIDCMSVIVHIFNEPTRVKYNLEALWGLRPSAEELAITGEHDWEEDLFPEFGEASYDAEEDDPE